MDAVCITGLTVVLWFLTPSGHAMDCVHANKQCSKDSTCAEMLRMVPDLCGNSDSRTTCDAPDWIQCEGILQILRQSRNFSGCDCDPLTVDYQDCREIHSQLYREPCTERVLIREVPTVSVQESTCELALNGCNLDDTCRQGLYEYLTKCQGDPAAGTCRRTACRHSIRAFLDTVSPRYTHPLLYCYCASDDWRCDMVWQGLNAECAYKLTPLRSCLDVKEQCTQSALCSTNFRNYQFQCAISESTGTGCAQSYSACRDARLGILGTIVAASCTCRGVEGADLEACKQQQLIVLDNSCFTRASLAYYPTSQNQDGSPTTAQPRMSIKRRVDARDGCVVRVWNGYPNVHVPAGHTIRIASDELADCTQICRCVKTGYLSQCFDILCDVTSSCPQDDRTVHDESRHCVCTGREQICIDKKLGFSNIDHPAMMIGYSAMEYDLIHRRLHVTMDAQTLLEKLQHVLAGVNIRNPCKLEIKTGLPANGSYPDGTIILTAHHSEHEKNWDCLNQLSDLETLINNRAPPVANDVILSVIKIASIIEGAPDEGQTQPKTGHARSCGICFVPPHLWINCLFILIFLGLKCN